MRLIESQSLVLHVFDYRETSRIVRLATRDAGIVSVIARGARRPKSRFGPALDLFMSGVAHLSFHPTNDLHTLTAFDSTRARPELAESMARFTAASALAEVCLRFAREDDSGRVHDAATTLLDAIGVACSADVAALALAGIWRVVAELGFAPSLDQCASCHADLVPSATVTFHHRAGGALCDRCARASQGGRSLPAEARLLVISWLAGSEREIDAGDDGKSARAHQRLLREFLEEHLGDGRPLRAFLAWETLRDRSPPVPVEVR
ncbi:MAG TPA: DNA repair protein RecO [Gemmatimonadaceae bacterium]|nr:DNA repair protein RecO [Gemmatimonadaceae bacterium]